MPNRCAVAIERIGIKEKRAAETQAFLDSAALRCGEFAPLLFIDISFDSKSGKTESIGRFTGWQSF
jgi:hypothetical protein